MKKHIIIPLTALFFASIVLIGLNFFMVRIQIGQVGVRTLQYSILGTQGVEPRDFGPGWHRSISMLDSWNLFDSTVQTAEFTTANERQMANDMKRSLFLGSLSRESYGSSSGPERIELKSRDGYTVKLDVTVKYQIAKDKVHELYRKFNNEVRYKEIARDQVQNTLRSVFGTMRTEEFYNPESRRQKTIEAETLLTRDLGENYIDLVSLLIRDISFDASYERKILDKKLADQDVELNKSRATAEEKKGETNIIIAETEAKVQVIEQEKKALQMTMKATTDKEISRIQAESKNTAARNRADADLYAAEMISKGVLLEKQAEASGEKLKANALQSEGGANLVALELVRSLDLKEMTVSTLDNDFLNAEAMILKLGAKP
jgi:regulator of protease activity HflC (stomatin/prohibitin superfamily)